MHTAQMLKQIHLKSNKFPNSLFYETTYFATRKNVGVVNGLVYLTPDERIKIVRHRRRRPFLGRWKAFLPVANYIATRRTTARKNNAVHKSRQEIT